MFWIALLAQITGPTPDSAKRWFTADDMPEDLLRRGSGLWLVPVRLNVSPNGELLTCEVEAKGKEPQLNKHTCDVIKRRAKFRPAKIDGLPVYGVYRTYVTYTVADAPLDTSAVSFPDIDVAVKRLPTGLKSPTLVRVMFVVDATGEKSACTADQSEGIENVDNHPNLLPVACEQIMKGYRASPAMVSGMPVVSVQNARVRFTAPPSEQTE